MARDFLSLVGSLIVTAVTMTTMVAGVDGALFLQGPNNSATQSRSPVTLYCHVMDNSTGSEQVYQGPYNITWMFTALRHAFPVKVATWIHNEDDSFNFISYTSPELAKVGNTQPPHLLILNTSLQDAGTYHCLSNVTSEEKTAELFVVEPITCHNENPSITFGQNASIDCLVHFAGTKAPQVDWLFGNKKMNSSITRRNDSYIEAQLKLVASDEMNGHIYNCHASYPRIFTYTCQAQPPLRIFVPAKVTTIITKPVRPVHTYAAGTAVSLQCAARGYPSPRFRWVFRPAAAAANADGVANGNQSQDGAVNLTGLSYYHIHHLEPGDAGVYTCLAFNSIYDREYTDSRPINISVLENKAAPSAAYVVHKGDNSRQGPTVTNTGESSSLKVSPYAIGALVSAGLAVLLIVIFVILAMRMKKQQKQGHQKLSRVHDENLDDQEVELLDEDALQPGLNTLPPEYAKLRMTWEVPRQDIRLIELIAKGSIVEVYKGRMRKYQGSSDIIKVAIKKLIDDAGEKDRKFFMAELEVLKMLPAHSNVIKLVASYTTNDPWLLMVELAGEGTLAHFLQRHRPGRHQVVISHGSSQSPAVRLQNQALTPHKLLALAAQVAAGMDHLHKFKLLYYRLRASSVLVARGGVCKLSGFGFPHEVAERNQYEANSLPVRWMAPESLEENVFNVKTDVWAYGILLWEVLHFGGLTPYPNMGPQEVSERVKEGYRMPQPEHVSSELHSLMSYTWHASPESRPLYNQILEALTQLATEPSQHIHFHSLPEALKSPDGDDPTLPVS